MVWARRSSKSDLETRPSSAADTETYDLDEHPLASRDRTRKTSDVTQDSATIKKIVNPHVMLRDGT
jgi:hypothetical protein